MVNCGVLGCSGHKSNSCLDSFGVFQKFTLRVFSAAEISQSILLLWVIACSTSQLLLLLVRTIFVKLRVRSVVKIVVIEGYFGLLGFKLVHILDTIRIDTNSLSAFTML